MVTRQTLPHLWLISDARNDAGLEAALTRLPRGSGFNYRAYHLESPDRIAPFRKLAATEWGAGGVYGAPRSLWPRRRHLRLATVHSLSEIGAANLLGADGLLLSPVFPTRSHPGGKSLGPLRFRLLARRAKAPVIALGGMDRRKAKRLGWKRWAAIDGLS